MNEKQLRIFLKYFKGEKVVIFADGYYQGTIENIYSHYLKINGKPVAYRKIEKIMFATLNGHKELRISKIF